MFVVPDSSVQIYHGIPLDKEYAHTIYFESREAQNTYFTLTMFNESYRLSRYTFIKEDGTLSVALDSVLTYDKIAKCNYMRFKNTAFYDKFFYAFIDKVELVNIGNAKLYFTLDVMQTWLPSIDYDFEHCFIERNHTSTDEIGDNIVPESLPTGEMVRYTRYVLEKTNEGPMSNWSVFSGFTWGVVIASSMIITTTWNGDTPITTITEQYGAYAGRYNCSGLYYCFYENNARGVAAFLSAVTEINNQGKASEIFSIFWYPQEFFPTNQEVGSVSEANFNRDSWTPLRLYRGFNQGRPYDNIDTYVPKNKKLYTYPYNYLYVATNGGDQQILRYEFFPNDGEDPYIYFYMGSVCTPNASVYLIPCNYKCYNNTGGIIAYPFMYDRSHDTQIEDVLSFCSMPEIVINSDLARAYAAQVKAGMGMRVVGLAGNVLGGASTTGDGAVARNLLHGAGAGLSAAGSVGAQLDALEVAPNKPSGVFSGDLTGLATGFSDFVFMRKSIRYDEAKRIDDYFTMYGYAIKEEGVPSIHNRENYTFIKTNNVHLKNQVFPHDIEEAICKIVNEGITFWTNPARIGDYSVSNRPLSEVNT